MIRFYEVRIRLLFDYSRSYPGKSIWHFEIESDQKILIEFERIADSKTTNNHTVIYFANFIISWTRPICGTIMWQPCSIFRQLCFRQEILNCSFNSLSICYSALWQSWWIAIGKWMKMSSTHSHQWEYIILNSYKISIN